MEAQHLQQLWATVNATDAAVAAWDVQSSSLLDALLADLRASAAALTQSTASLDALHASVEMTRAQ